MGGSSIRNSVHRRNHKERAQPAARKRLGLLEKHKDYVQRAHDYKSKKNRLRNLREKISLRNKDEFYWGMVKGKTKAGIHIQSRGNEALPMDMVKLLKTQDAGYLRTQIASDESVSYSTSCSPRHFYPFSPTVMPSISQKKIAAIKEQLHSLADLIPSAEEALSDDDDDLSSDGGGWDDMDAAGDEGMHTDEDDLEVEQLLATGVIAPPKVQTKGKGKEVEGAASKGHIIFTDTKDECKSSTDSWPRDSKPWLLCFEGVSYSVMLLTVLSYQRTPASKLASSLSKSTTTTKQPTPSPQDFGWKDPSKKGKKAQQEAAYQPSPEAIARFEQRQAEREKALVKQAKASTLSSYSHQPLTRILTGPLSLLSFLFPRT
ncbi:hypothetical protein QFC19_004209 [Naganishia cerealis]|uniref:Uncharacterized protein n=1 Tax=Naganishia cerealis TaxID=610337 RepID=A0ACC2VXC1_9TREE|nr:hypothetical protein QFC19_004209 [Naganishia cerealis]